MTGRPPRIKERPEDFVVEEIPLYAPTGEGGHTFVHVEKRLRTTEEVARALARLADVPSRDVGYAGRKDRVAVARQWFSVPALPADRARELDVEGVRVLDVRLHPHKLRTGQLRGNRFAITVRGVDVEGAAAAQRRLAGVVAVGLPNRFGDQRFGRGGANPERGRELLTGRAPSRDRRAARFLVSALQAEVFNEVLRRRPLPLDRVEVGDVAMLHVSGGCFVVEDAARENERAARFEISATGPIFGTRCAMPTGAVAEREARVLADLGIPEPAAWRLPRGLRLRGARRPLRVRPEAVSLVHRDDALHLGFELPAGSFASVLVEEIVGAVATGSAEDPPRLGATSLRDDTADGPAVC